MLLDDVQTRIDDQIPTLAGRVHKLADLAELMAKGALPQVTPAAYVVPLGLRARSEGQASAGAFTQILDELVAIVIVDRAGGDVTGGKSLGTIEGLRDALIAAIAGWGPDTAIGVFSVSRGQLAPVSAGAVIFQLDFVIQMQIRNFSS